MISIVSILVVLSFILEAFAFLSCHHDYQVAYKSQIFVQRKQKSGAPNKVNVEFIKDFEGYGKTGDVKAISYSYFLNFLFPRKIAKQTFTPFKILSNIDVGFNFPPIIDVVEIENMHGNKSNVTKESWYLLWFIVEM